MIMFNCLILFTNSPCVRPNPETPSLPRFHILADLLGNKRSWFAICDCWISIHSVFLGSLLLSFRVRSRDFEKGSKFYFYSSKFFLASLYWNMVSLYCSYRAFKSRRNTDMEGWLKRIGTFSLTFTFAASAHYCRLYWFDKHSVRY